MQDILNKLKLCENENENLFSKMINLNKFNKMQTEGDPNGVSSIRVKVLEG